MRLVFWQPNLSIHQEAHLHALSEAGVDVTVVAEEGVPPKRKAIGWPVPDFGSARVIVGDGDESQRVARDAGRDQVHIFSGLRPGTLARRAFQTVVRTRARVGIMAESGDWRGAFGAARRAFAWIDRVRFCDDIAFILAIGSTGVSWFRACGYSELRIFPYGYFVNRSTPGCEARPFGGPKRVVYAGSLLELKGVDVLIDAMARVRGEWSLTIVGNGPEKGRLERLVGARRLETRVRFFGPMRWNRIQAELAGYDLLVLPSRWKDGWGVVVNEALLVGTPVVCTDACGASHLIRDSWRGSVVRAGSISALGAAIESQLDNATAERRHRIAHWADCIQGPAAAEYLLQVVTGQSRDRPIPPWLRGTSTRSGVPARIAPEGGT